MAWARKKDGKLYKDSNGKNVRTDDWENLPKDLWNSSTVMEYLNHLNIQKYGVAPSLTNVKFARFAIVEDLETFGTEVVMEFCKQAVQRYKGNKAYPTLSYQQAKYFYGDELYTKIMRTKLAEIKSAENGDEEITW